MKKVLVMALSLVLIATLAISTTVAYLTSEDSDVNVMKLGNVKIEQIEQEWNEGETALDTFTQNKPLMPYVGTLGWENKDDQGGAFRRFTMNNVVDKYVSVKNTGRSDAYVRTVFAFEMGGYASIEEWRNKIVGFSRNTIDGDEFDFPGTWDWSELSTAKINGQNYAIWTATYESPLTPNKTTIPSLLQVYMNKDCNNAEVEKLDGNKNGTYDILVLSQAVQTDGFADAKIALETAFGKTTAENAAKWFGGMKIPDASGDSKNGDDDNEEYEIPSDAVAVSSEAELVTKLNEGKTAFVLKEGTYQIDNLKSKSNLSIYGESKKTVIELVNEGEFGMDYGFDGSTVKFYGLTFDTSKMTKNQSNQDPTWPGFARMQGEYYDCVFKGSFDPVSGTHKFEYCTFEVTGNNYNCWIYGASNVDYTNCTFNCDGKSIYVDGNGETGTKLNVKNCVFNDNGDGSVVNDKAAIETGTTYGKTYELTVTNTDVNGFTVNPTGISTNSTLWANKHNMGTDKLNVIVDGVDVY